MGTFNATFTLTVGSSPNVGGFNITGNPGSVSIATGVSRSALAAGVTYNNIDDTITEFTIASTGDCTNSVTKFVDGGSGGGEGSGFCFVLELDEMTYQNSTLSIRHTPVGGELTLTALQGLEVNSEFNGEVTIFLCSETTPTWWNTNNEQVVAPYDFISLGTNCTTNGECVNGGEQSGSTLTPTPTPTFTSTETNEPTSYFCKETEGSPCVEQLGPCIGNQIDCAPNAV
jgi:hypothetical protein